MATATAPPVVAPAATKESALPPATPPQGTTTAIATDGPPPLDRKTSSLTKDASSAWVATSKPKPPAPVKDVPKSPVNGHTNGHAVKPHSRPNTPRSPLLRHPSGDHGHPHGCGCHKCIINLDATHVHPHGCGCHKCTYTQVTHVGEAYCPNPETIKCKDYETKVRIIQRIPEMRKVEKTCFVKQLVHEKRTQTVRKSRIIMEDIEIWEKVPVVKEVPRLKKITIHKIHEEVKTVTDMVPVIEYQKRTRIEPIPRCVVEDVDEVISVPVIKEVAVVQTVQEPTGEFCEQPIEEYCTPGDFNLLCKDGRHHGEHHKNRSDSRCSSDSESDSDESDDEKSHHSHSHDHEKSPKWKKPLSPIKTKPLPDLPKVPVGPTQPKEPETQPKVIDSKPKPYDDAHPPEVPDSKPTVPETKPKVIDSKPKPHDDAHPPEVPDSKPTVPETKPKVPEPKPTVPETKPKVPESKPKVPEPKPTLPETKPKVPETKSKVPETQPKIPETKAHEDNSSKKVDVPPKPSEGVRNKRDNMLQTDSFFSIP